MQGEQRQLSSSRWLSFGSPLLDFGPSAAVPVFSSYLSVTIGGVLQLRWVLWSLEVLGHKKASGSQLRQLKLLLFDGWIWASTWL